MDKININNDCLWPIHILSNDKRVRQSRVIYALGKFLEEGRSTVPLELSCPNCPRSDQPVSLLITVWFFGMDSEEYGNELSRNEVKSFNPLLTWVRSQKYSYEETYHYRKFWEFSFGKTILYSILKVSVHIHSYLKFWHFFGD